jgi:RHS repeat-associated protein
VRTPQGSHYYLTDNIGSVVALTGPGSNADVSATYRYDPFGQTTDTTGDLTQPYRYAGQYLDTETRHYKIGLRYYNPQLARWTQQDPLTGYTDPRRANPYIYAGQDPINQVDASGAIFGDVIDTIGDVADIASVGCIGVGIVATPAAGAACGFIAGGVSIAASATDVARNPGVSSGLAGGSVAGGFACQTLGAIGKIRPLASDACGLAGSALGLGT